MNRRNFLKWSASAFAAANLHSIYAHSNVHAPAQQEGLRVRFLGTGAADWNGRDERGELRRNASVLLDEIILIDLTPTVIDMLPKGCKPKAIFYTHSHGDHYKPLEAVRLNIPQVYVGQTWIERARNDFQKAAAQLNRPMPDVAPLNLGDAITIEGITLTALPANHATSDYHEQTLIYLVQKENVRLLYATDTGGLTAIATRIAGIDAHLKPEQRNPITALIMEATMGIGYDNDFRLFCHSDVSTVQRTAHVLAHTGCYTPPQGQPVYLTHMARTLHGTQAELDAQLPAPLRAPYDGLEVIFKAPR
ncbi:MAG: MBL fold metallo-hydrolase [Bacteroidales bacterium]|nr:MBL fold metallo-hydrolase [Bacteroidales bacterium]